MCVFPDTHDFTENFRELQEYTALVKSGQATADTYRVRSHAFEMIQSVEAALADLNIAIPFEPPLPTALLADAYNRRCVVNRRLMHVPEAIADGEMAVKLAPDKAQYYTNLASARFVAEDYPGALADLEHVLQADPHDIEGLHWRIRVHKALGNAPAAIADQTLMLDVTPYARTSSMYLSRAEDQLQIGAYREAEADCTAGLDHHMKRYNVELWRLHLVRGWARYYLKEVEGALGDFLDCLDVKEEATYAYLGLALVYRAIGGDTAAEANFNKFTQAHPKGAGVALQEIAVHLMDDEPVTA